MSTKPSSIAHIVLAGAAIVGAAVVFFPSASLPVMESFHNQSINVGDRVKLSRPHGPKGTVQSIEQGRFVNILGDDGKPHSAQISFVEEL